MSTHPGQQLVFDLPTRKAQGIDDFLITPSSQRAATLIEDWRKWPSHCAILVGPAGSGKSHLAEIWRQATRGCIVKAEALHRDDIFDLLEFSAVAVEDLPGAKLDERALFHLLNLTKEKRGHVLLTARSYPQSWNIRLPDLKSRLKAAITVEIGAPDDALLRGVLVKLFADRQIAVDEAIIDYLVARMPRAFDAARTIVAAIDRRALELKAPVSRNLVARVFAEIYGKSEQEEA